MKIYKRSLENSMVPGSLPPVEWETFPDGVWKGREGKRGGLVCTECQDDYGPCHVMWAPPQNTMLRYVGSIPFSPQLSVPSFFILFCPSGLNFIFNP